MTNEFEAADRARADVLRQTELAADQIDAWTDQREALVCKAFAQGVSQRKIAPYARLDQATISRIIARKRAESDDPTDVG